ncbi:HBR429Cp [Eremothecium sinecaudum]|uniref:HBR429Cp n=1 Tax=Eremothecium sinecaudum TaxID=45286 RepID=A0A109UVI6_9SACH|nr:HBR429Cp [Eremothecium sinecaudum]AMD19330.1 HBR429Cp [Eremothecium sinecaudum]
MKQSRYDNGSPGEQPAPNSASLIAAKAMFKKYSDGNTDNCGTGVVAGSGVLHRRDKIGRSITSPVGGKSIKGGTSGSTPQMQHVEKTAQSPRSMRQGSGCVSDDGLSALAAVAAASKAVQSPMRSAAKSSLQIENEPLQSPFLLSHPQRLVSGLGSVAQSNDSSMSLLTSGTESQGSFDKIINTIRQNEAFPHITMDSPSQRSMPPGYLFSPSAAAQRLASVNSDTNVLMGPDSRITIPPIRISTPPVSTEMRTSLRVPSIYRQRPSNDLQSIVSSMADTALSDNGEALPKHSSLTPHYNHTASSIMSSPTRHLRRIPPPKLNMSDSDMASVRILRSTSSSLSSTANNEAGHSSDDSDSEYTEDEDSSSDEEYSGYEDVDEYLQLRNETNQGLESPNLEESENESLEGVNPRYAHGANPKEVTIANVSYSTLNKIPMNLKYSGTLPNLIPNYQRKQSKWLKFFRRTKAAADPSSSLPVSQIYAENDTALIKSKLDVRFQTTMRGILNDSAISETSYLQEYDSDDSDSYVVDKSKALKKHSKKSGKRRERIRNNLRYRGAFDEDKPWKSHLDLGYVTERERKRYEGMWVTNKDTYLELLPWWKDRNSRGVVIPEDGLMINIVVSDIWSKSNLPKDTLAQIYQMVDTRHDGTLDRNSFVVGMWLVDQSLYGRKLPRQIDSRVWDSVSKYVINVSNANENPKHHHRTRKKLLKKELKMIKKESKSYHS